MKTLKYSVNIDAPVELVFKTIMDKSVYSEWAKAWGEDMTFEGKWEEGSYISFFDASSQGTKVVVEEIKPNRTIKMKHVAMVEAGNKEVTQLDETMQKWFGSKEDYYFEAVNQNETKLTVIIETDQAFEPMMQAWDKALVYFKRICETT